MGELFSVVRIADGGVNGEAFLEEPLDDPAGHVASSAGNENGVRVSTGLMVAS